GAGRAPAARSRESCAILWRRRRAVCVARAVHCERREEAMTQTQTLPASSPFSTAPSLVDQHLLSFARDGYLIFQNVVDRGRLAQLHGQMMAALEEAKVSGGLFAGGGNLAGHLNCS